MGAQIGHDAFEPGFGEAGGGAVFDPVDLGAGEQAVEQQDGAGRAIIGIEAVDGEAGIADVAKDGRANLAHLASPSRRIGYDRPVRIQFL